MSLVLIIVSSVFMILNSLFTTFGYGCTQLSNIRKFLYGRKKHFKIIMSHYQ